MGIELQSKRDVITAARSYGLKGAAAAGSLVWLLSIVLPTSIHDYQGMAFQGLYVDHGWELLALGWLGPVAPIEPPVAEDPFIRVSAMPIVPFMGSLGLWLLKFSWFANPIWAWNTWRMLRSRQPVLVLALLGGLLAIAGLQPYYWAFDDHGAQSNTVALTGAYIWAIAMLMPLAVALMAILITFARRPPAIIPFAKGGRSDVA